IQVIAFAQVAHELLTRLASALLFAVVAHCVPSESRRSYGKAADSSREPAPSDRRSDPTCSRTCVSDLRALPAEPRPSRRADRTYSWLRRIFPAAKAPNSISVPAHQGVRKLPRPPSRTATWENTRWLWHGAMRLPRRSI